MGLYGAAGRTGMMCLASNEHVADLLGLTADVLVPSPASRTDRSACLGRHSASKRVHDVL